MMSGKVPIRWLRRIASSESGSAMVETALTFPILIAMLLGTVELGDLAYKANEVTNAARSAAQYASSTSGAYTDCDGTVANVSSPTYATAKTCSTSRGMYITAQRDAPLTIKTCTFAVKEATSCICSDSAACASSSSAGYTCAARPVIMVSVYTQAVCSPAASIPNLFPVGGTFTLNGYSQQEVTN